MKIEHFKVPFLLEVHLLLVLYCLHLLKRLFIDKILKTIKLDGDSAYNFKAVKRQ